jgi:hypothetical protein
MANAPPVFIESAECIEIRKSPETTSMTERMVDCDVQDVERTTARFVSDMKVSNIESTCLILIRLRNLVIDVAKASLMNLVLRSKANKGRGSS